MKKKAVLTYLVCFSICSLFADSGDLLNGLDAYSRGDWNVAVQSFEQSLTAAPDDRTEAFYWLVMAETSAQNYERALYYADEFLKNAPEDERAAEVSYQKGRLLHLSGSYEKSSETLYGFIEAYPDHPKIPSAHYWIGENFYVIGNHTEARKIFSDIVADYPHSGKVNEARYKIVLIDQQAVRGELLRMASEVNTVVANAEKIPESDEPQTDGTEVGEPRTEEPKTDEPKADDIEVSSGEDSSTETGDSPLAEEQQQNEDVINRLTALEEKLNELSAVLARIAQERDNQHTQERREAFEQQQEAERQQREQEELERQQLEQRRQDLTELKERTRTLEKLYTQRVKGAK